MGNTILASPNWRYKISIKNQFNDETSPELIIILCDSIWKQLGLIRNKVNDMDDSKIYDTGIVEITDYELFSKLIILFDQHSKI